MRALIVDDEPLARNRLRRLLSEKSVEIVGESGDGENAIALTKELKPDIVFLDIDMPKLNGIKVAEVVRESMDDQPAIVFCTAHSEYALRAFQTGAESFVLKPVGLDDLSSAIERAKGLNLLQKRELSAGDSTQINLTIRVGAKLEKTPLSSFGCFFSHERCVYGIHKNGSEILLDYTLAQLIGMNDARIVRVNRTHLINVDYIRSVDQDNKEVFLRIENKEVFLKVSRRQMPILKEAYFSDE